MNCIRLSIVAATSLVISTGQASEGSIDFVVHRIGNVRSEALGVADSGGGESRPDGGEPDELRKASSHSFTPPAVMPAMYCRCSTANSASTGSTVSTEPAIISSVSWACSPSRLASATGRV